VNRAALLNRCIGGFGGKPSTGPVRWIETAIGIDQPIDTLIVPNEMALPMTRTALYSQPGQQE
jgi:hypothetical protein